jgi:hypothetical protein
MALAFIIASERDVAAAAPRPDADLAGGSSSRSPPPCSPAGRPDGAATFNRTAAQRLLIRIYMPCQCHADAGGGAAAGLSWPGGLAPTEHGGGLNAPNASKQAPNEFPQVQAEAGPRRGAGRDEQCRAAHMGILSDPRNHHHHLARSHWPFSPPIPPAASLRITGPQVHACASASASDHARGDKAPAALQWPAGGWVRTGRG